MTVETASHRPARLAGKRAIVTGTGPNIGAGIALELAAAGAHVWALDRDPRSATQCANQIVEAGGSASPLECDITDPDAVAAAVDQATADGPVDVLVNSAAHYREEGLLEMPYEGWTAQLSVILHGTFLMTRAVAAKMVATSTRGSIINVASTAAHQGQPGNIAYCTAKAGLLNFTRAAAMDLASMGIRVNTLTPTSTDLSDKSQRAHQWGVPPPTEAAVARSQRSRSVIPFRKLPTPSDYGKAAVFLASEDAAMITGAELRVDAGALARYWAWT